MVVGATACLTAKTANCFVRAALLPTPESLTEAATAALGHGTHNPNTRRISIDAFLERNLFNAAREGLDPMPGTDKTIGPDGQQYPDLDSCRASSIGVVLLATIVHQELPGESMAIFQNTSPGQSPHGVREGDQLLEVAKVFAIHSRSVYVDHDGLCESFSLDAEIRQVPAQTKAVAQSKGSRPRGPQLGAGITKTSEGEYAVPRQDIDHVLSNLSVVATQGRIMPNFERGKMNGFKLTSMRRDSLYARIGMQNNDVIQRVNGHELSSPEEAVKIYGMLKDSEGIKIDILRGGKAKTLSYRIQ